MLRVQGKRYGFEFKLSEAPGTSKSMHIALETLGLEWIFVIHPGQAEYPLAERITACPLDQPETWSSGIRCQESGINPKKPAVRF